ncbi:MAG: glycosyltransferase family 39 protein [Candidatus Aminicenantes bacterium]|nr:glycosyltransferase family 39 protein [Candidatus Aminicenantes bacterium]
MKPITTTKQIIILLLALLTVNVLLYLPSLQHDFLKDDFRLIVENQRIKTFKSFLNSINGQFFSFPDFPYLHYWRPLSLFSFYLDYQIWGLNPLGFHLTNILLNALNAMLLFLFFYFISRKILPAFFISLFFSLHPAHVEAVSWISGRTDLLSALFIFSAALLFLLFLEKEKKTFYLFSVICFTLALLAKENAVLFPLAAALLISRDISKESIKKKNYLLILFLAAIDIIYLILHHTFTGMQNILQNFSFKDILLICKTAGVYTKIILAPFSPAPYYSMQQFEQHHVGYYVYFLVGLLLLALVASKRKEYRCTFYSLLFLIFLLPVLDPRIIPTNPRIALRFAYIPAVLAGVFFMETIQFLKHKILRRVFIGMLILIAGAWTVESFGFQGFFKNEGDHYRQLVKYYPDDGSLLLPLALQKAGTGSPADLSGALELVNRALAMNGDRWADVSEPAGLLKANLLVVSGDLARAGEGKSLAEKILAGTEKKEISYFAYLVLSKFHEKRQEFPAALAMLEKAESIGETADLYFRMAVVRARMKDYGNALQYLEKARAMNPELSRYSELKEFILKNSR